MLILFFLTLLIAPTFAALCRDRTVNTVEQIVSPTGYKFNVTRSTCISPSTPDRRDIELKTRFESVVNKRSASECTTPDCVCGRACTIQCFTNPTVPDVTDCTNLRNSILSTMEGTFTVQSDDSLSVSGPGCEFFASVLAIGNSLQFCWDDFANIGLQNAETCSPNLLPECNGAFGGFSNAWGISDLGDTVVN